MKDITRPYNYNTSIKFKNGTRTIYGTHIDNFKDGGMNVFSAYRITKEFINEKIINKYRSIIDIEEFSKDQAEEELRGIMGIFALKLMGDFSQELYSLCLSNRTLGAEVLPILFVANDRVSAARYILLKQFGIRGDGSGPLINEPGGGGFLSYGSKKNNYFLIIDRLHKVVVVKRKRKRK